MEQLFPATWTQSHIISHVSLAHERATCQSEWTNVVKFHDGISWKSANYKNIVDIMDKYLVSIWNFWKKLFVRKKDS